MAPSQQDENIDKPQSEKEDQNASAPHRMSYLDEDDKTRRRQRSSSHKYSRFVRLLRFVLPVMAFIILGSLLLWPQVDRDLQKVDDAVREKPSLKKDIQTNRLSEAKYEDVDEKGRPFSIEAEEAMQKQDNPDLVLLTKPRARLMMDANRPVKIRADRGQYNQTTQELNLTDNVVIEDAENNILRTESARVEFQIGYAESLATVTITGPKGEIEAVRMTIQNRGSKILFHGPARLILNTDSPIHPAAQQNSAINGK